MIIIVAYSGKKTVDIREGSTSNDPIDRVVEIEVDGNNKPRRYKAWGGKDAFDRYQQNKNRGVR